MKCPKCRSSGRVKNGFMRGSQRYKCKSRGCNYSVDYDSVENKGRKRRLALSLYLESLGFHSIGRLLGASHVSVLNWGRKYGRGFAGIHNPHPCKVMELDEMHSYQRLKNCRWIWHGVDRDAKEYVDVVIGGQKFPNGDKALAKEQRPSHGYRIVAADCWKVYNEIIPTDRLVQTKAETYTVERYNSWFKTTLKGNL